MEDIKKMFRDVEVKKGENVGINSIVNMKLPKISDHYTICPFRSIDLKECPLCKLDELGEI